MERLDPSSFILQSQKITGIFGHWPTFHDAVVHSLALSGGYADPCEPDSESPMLDMTIHLWEMTKEISPEGYIVLSKHTIAELRFRNIEQLELSGFNYHNCILELTFATEPEDPNPPGGGRRPELIAVQIEPSFGLSAGFKCRSVEVISAVPCDEHGIPPD
jgi:hypothetical protein